ncbi:Ldh family oxidoreductase [Labedella populi]|uniref:Ldh family oxidoreductase n=1 Tax=Labedella populi TaxID=2498850 RepID=UPI0014085A18|nr:Ldh family oxidoreductase [Labedella populi]
MEISITEAATLGARSLERLGYSTSESRTVVDHLIDCELRGLAYSGLARVLSIADRLSTRPRGHERSEVVRDSPVAATIDAHDELGYLAAPLAASLVREKAFSNGIAAVAVRDTWYTGMLSYYAEPLADAGLVVMAVSNASPWVAVSGGSDPLVGTNPICIAVPTADRPIVWDIGTSAITHADTVLAGREGRSLPGGVAFGPDGAPTTDPASALAGALAPWGGHRGSGLAMAVQLLGMHAGSAALPSELSGFGMSIVAMRSDLFADEGHLEREASAFSDAVRTSRPLDPSAPVRLPFGRSRALRTDRRRRGTIDVSDAVLDAVAAL